MPAGLIVSPLKAFKTLKVNFNDVSFKFYSEQYNINESKMEDYTEVPDEYNVGEECSINLTVHEELNKNDISFIKGHIKFNEYNKFLKGLKGIAHPSPAKEEQKAKSLFQGHSRMKKWNTRDCRAPEKDFFKFKKHPSDKNLHTKKIWVRKPQVKRSKNLKK